MDGFEYFFTLFGLLLGFSLVEVISGFGRAIEITVNPLTDDGTPSTRIGWLSPLLGLFVIFNLVSFWTAAWSLRDVIPVHYLALTFGVLVTGGYYLAAMLVFPKNIHAETNLDNHYFQVRRWVLMIIILCNVLGATGMAIVGTNSLPGLADLIFYGLLIALFFARGYRANLLILIPLATGYPLTSLIAFAL